MSTKTNTTVSTTAAELASFLWGQVSASFDAAHLIARLHEESGRDIGKAGAALGEEWSKIGGDVVPEKPIRLLLEACSNMDWTDKDARAFIRGAGFIRPADVKAEKGDGMIAKQRLAVLCKAVYGGMSNAEAGAHGKGKDKAVNTLLTAEQILAALDHVKFTEEQIKDAVLKFQAMLA